MLNYVQLQDDLKNLSDDQIRMIALNPANPMHGTLAVGELDRRNRIRMDYQSRMANPMTTVAQQVVLGVPNTPPMDPSGGMGGGGMQALAPQQPQQTQAVGMPMEFGGDVNSNLRQYQEMLRLPQLENLAGAMEQARGMLGEDPTLRLREMVEEYRRGGGRRRNMDITQLLMRIGSGLMNSRRPDYLGALGEGASGGVAGLADLVERRNAEERQGIEDEGALARITGERQNRAADVGARLFGTAREGIGAAADIEEGIGNRATQLGVAQLYASRARGGAGGLSSADIVSLRQIFNRASIAAGQARGQVAQLRRNGYDENDPEMQSALGVLRQLEQEEDQARQAVLDALSGESGMGGLERDLNYNPGRYGEGGGEMPGPAQSGVAQTRERGGFYGGVNSWLNTVRLYDQARREALQQGLQGEQARRYMDERMQQLAAESGVPLDPSSIGRAQANARNRTQQDLGGYSIRQE